MPRLDEHSEFYKEDHHEEGESSPPPSPPSPREPRFNALKHGCCARTPVLPGEDEALWREIEQEWFEEYDPQTATSRTFVAEATVAFWNKVRCRHKLEEVNLALQGKNAMDWSNEDHQKYSRFLRYQTAADRAFSRAFKELEYLRKARLSQGEAMRRVEEQEEKLRLGFLQLELQNRLGQAKQQLQEQKHLDQQANKEKDRALKREQLAAATQQKAATTPTTNMKKKKNTFDTAEQWLEVRIVDGVTTTYYIPSNDDLIEELEKKEVEPKMVYRRLNFPDGLPPEYAWTNLHRPETCELGQAGRWCPKCIVKERGGQGLQRMTWDTWLQVIEREKQTPGRHAGPTGVGNLPTPKERGGDLDYAELLALEQRQKELRLNYLESAPENEKPE